ncbi:ATP-binding protein [Streptomyces katsurahamanus]|uniref:ATP-binding protein n=1 Tax=Streptomyces katsurahamanus TaxID=2577098 RepID=A0ABW9P1M0_9ACTN|nr:ATP-binding protein [Streptomyces katsurahamanus]
MGDVNHTTQTSSPTRQFSVQLSATRRGARLARLLTVEQLRSWEREFDTAAHIVAELAANAATHGRVQGRDFRLTVTERGGILRIEVTDTRGDRFPVRRRDAAEEDESGRGLVLVEALADRWGVSSGPAPGKTVWAELTFPPEHGRPRSGAPGSLPQETNERKEPRQTPPLPPEAGLTRTGEHPQLRW